MNLTFLSGIGQMREENEFGSANHESMVRRRIIVTGRDGPQCCDQGVRNLRVDEWVGIALDAATLFFFEHLLEIPQNLRIVARKLKKECLCKRIFSLQILLENFSNNAALAS